ncbi:hypothetical protein [Actinomyces succiniciruminis]|uniref:Uncharacterized protein n=1 Tax=Actinomyces succiniciruminis TaxID=1522002 RepID=A0A1L7RBN2_9ACTO|nr:hypothetical protein [Actinomyces succiniciruminis]CED91307.1 Hypothetical protein AAM4_1475 [Actinomyces succiniciruminis]
MTTTPAVATRSASPAMRRVVATLDATAWDDNRDARPGQVAEIAEALLDVLAYPTIAPPVRGDEAAPVPADVDELAALLDQPDGELDAGESTMLLQAAMELRRLVDEDRAMTELLGGLS